jgi:hypothetical protein
MACSTCTPAICNFANNSVPVRICGKKGHCCTSPFTQSNMVDAITGETAETLPDWTEAPWDNPADVDKTFNSAGRQYMKWKYGSTGVAPAAMHCQRSCMSGKWKPDGSRLNNCGYLTPTGGYAGQEWRGLSDQVTKTCHIGYWDKNNKELCCNTETGFGDGNTMLCAPSWAPVTSLGASSVNAVNTDDDGTYNAAQLGTCDDSKATRDYCFSKDPVSGSLNVASGGVCQGWCNRIGDDCDQQMIDYCDPNKGPNAASPECACLQPKASADYQNMLAALTAVGIQPTGNLSCFFGACKDETSTLKTGDQRIAAMTCQTVTMNCINNVTNIVPIQVDPDDIDKNNIAAVSEDLSNQCDQKYTSCTTNECEPDGSDGTGQSNTPGDGKSPTCNGGGTGSNDKGDSGVSTGDSNGDTAPAAATNWWLVGGGITVVVIIIALILLAVLT